jgi:hypothetical protein
MYNAPIVTLDCNEPHASEVYSVVDIEADSYDKVYEFIMPSLSDPAAAESYYPSLKGAGMNVNVIAAFTQATWDAGHRTAAFTVTTPNGQVGSVKGLNALRHTPPSRAGGSPLFAGTGEQRSRMLAAC